MAVSDEFKSILDHTQKLKYKDNITIPTSSGYGQSGNEHFLMLDLMSLRDTLSDNMVKAMVEVEWPEGMSTADQMKAMFGAAINVVLEGLDPEKRD